MAPQRDLGCCQRSICFHLSAEESPQSTERQMAVRSSMENPKLIHCFSQIPGRPVVIYNCGGLGDHLMSLPALRALAHLWPHRLIVICAHGASSIFFTNIDILQAQETMTFHTLHGRPGGVRLNPMPSTNSAGDHPGTASGAQFP